MTKDHATVAQLVEQWATKADEAGELGREYEHRDLIRSAYYYTEAASYRARSDELAAALAQGGAAVYPDSDRGLKQMCPGVPVAILRGIQEAAFRAGRESVLTPLAQGGAHEPPTLPQRNNAGLIEALRIRAKGRIQSLLIMATRDEFDQVKLAARLRHMPIEEYVKRAVNAQMRKEGVDAVLFRESDDDI